MLTGFGLQRYRAFVDEAILELRPLTLLFGRNSAGKSALLRAIPLVAASAGPVRPNRTGPLALEHEAAMGAAYADLRSRLSPRNDLVIRLSWDENDRAAPRTIEYHLRDIADLSQTGQVVERALLKDSAGGALLEMVLDLDTGLYGVPSEPSTITFQGLVPVHREKPSSRASSLVDSVRSLLTQLEPSVDWLGPLRIPVPRRADALATPTILHDGGGTTELLSLPSNRELLDWVSTRTGALFGHDLESRADADGFSLVADFGGGRLAQLADVGSGASQIVPVLAHLARMAAGAARGRIVAIEQPEAHLHADAEAALGSAIAEALEASRSAPRSERPILVMETHSENILLSLQLAGLEGRLACEDWVAYWVSRAEDGAASIERITFDEQARPSPDWPSGVFSETTDLARQVLNARRRGRR